MPEVGVGGLVAEGPDGDATKAGLFYQLEFVVEGTRVFVPDLVGLEVLSIDEVGGVGVGIEK